MDKCGKQMDVVYDEVYHVTARINTWAIVLIANDLPCRFARPAFLPSITKTHNFSVDPFNGVIWTAIFLQDEMRYVGATAQSPATTLQSSTCMITMVLTATSSRRMRA